MNVHLTVQVPRSPDLDKTLEHVQHRLEPLLMAFQPELVQLQGRLVRHTSREGVICHLNLHLPTGQLSSEEKGATAQIAVRTAADELVRQLNRHKERLRETRPRQRTEFQPGPAPGTANGHAERSDLAAARRADLAGYFGAHYSHVLQFVTRQIQMREALGEIPPGRLEPDEVLDEIVVAALESTPQQEALQRGRWLLLLAADAIRRLTKTYSGREHGQEMQSLQRDPLATDEPDPEQLAENTEMLGQLAAVLKTLPSDQRHDVELYLLEGFRPDELAQLSQRSRSEVEDSLRRAEQSLRALAVLPVQIRQRLRDLPRSA